MSCCKSVHLLADEVALYICTSELDGSRRLAGRAYLAMNMYVMHTDYCSGWEMRS
jgi:hypothetical protein